jgi:hypothetical protein
LTEVERAAACERLVVSRLIALLMEVDSRKLYAGQGYSSLFTYCMRVLHLSEHAAYLRIEAARSARRFPEILEKLADGSLHLTAVSLLAPHLSDANHVQLIDAATHMSKRDVEGLIARLRPQPDVPSSVRKLPAPASPVAPKPPVTESAGHTVPSTPIVVDVAPARPAIIKPTAPKRYKVQFTMSHEMYEKLRRVQDVMRHSIPDGDPSVIFDRALTLLLADLLKAKCGVAEHSQRPRPKPSRGRHIPATVKRDVWRRDEGRCAFRGVHGRCNETGFLEFHHVVPYADGGEASTSNIQLRCRAHNEYESELWSGVKRAPLVRETRVHYGA